MLVLNKNYLPITTTTVKRAVIMLCCEVAKVVGSNYETYDFSSWTEISSIKNSSAQVKGDFIRTVTKMIKIPKVILLLRYERMPKREVKFNRINIFRRDNDTCQYCGKNSFRSELTLDHVVPRSLGGTTTWENIVCCCIPCNRRKGGKTTPEAAGMNLLKKPGKPHWTPMSNISLNVVLLKEWEPFLTMVDISYWNVELES